MLPYNHLNSLRSLFPYMDDQVLTTVLTECGHNIDLAIRKLNALHLTPTREAAHSDRSTASPAPQTDALHAANGTATDSPSPASSGPRTGDEWVGLLVSEMSAARDMDDARKRGAGVLQAFEQFVGTKIKAEARKDSSSDGAALQARLTEALRENHILKKAVQIQNTKLHEAAVSREQEVAALKQSVAQYQERLRTLEMNNYSLALHLQKATSAGVLSNQRPPDVF